jgi:hypothetical protein
VSESKAGNHVPPACNDKPTAKVLMREMFLLRSVDAAVGGCCQMAVTPSYQSVHTVTLQLPKVPVSLS